jgi:steroid 5-alpha reductase family enzyme
MNVLIDQSGIIMTSVAVVFIYMCFLFVIAVLKKDNSIADIGYGIGAIVATLPAYVGQFAHVTDSTLGQIFPFLLVTLWGVRLSLRIYLKNKGKIDDFRYALWRTQWTWFYLRSFFQVFMLQGSIIFLIALPVIIYPYAFNHGVQIASLFSFGAIIWFIGFYFECVGDWQLDHFIKTSVVKGTLMTTGLWAYSRHPNYFGESLMWWGLWVTSLSVAGEIWYITIASPILITFLLLRVSGIPLLEKKLSTHPDWESYARKTSVFIPWCRKIEKS